MPERAQDSVGIVPGSGGVSAEPFASFDRASWSWRTSQGSLLEDSTSFSGPWPVSGVMRNGKLYARATSGRHSFARESSLWLTPNATPGATSNNGEDAGRPATGKSLAKQADGRWPTPTAGDSKSAGSRNLEGSEAHAGVSLTDAVRFGNSTTPRQWQSPQTSDANGVRVPDGKRSLGLNTQATWMTPQSRDHKGISQKMAKGEYTGGLPDQLLGMQRGPDGPPAPESPNTPGSRPASSPPLVLNALWVSALMGFPINWLDEFLDGAPMPMPQKLDPQKSCESCKSPLTRKRFNGRLEDRNVFLQRRFCGETCSANGALVETPTLSGIRQRAQRAYTRGPVCECCGQTHQQMDRHHKDGDPTNNAPDNLQTLTAPCHARLHWRTGKREQGPDGSADGVAPPSKRSATR